MIEFEILKEVTLAINQDREKKKAEKIKEWKARANNVSAYICSLPISHSQRNQLVDKITDLLDVALDWKALEAIINESNAIMKIFDEDNEDNEEKLS